MTTPKYNEPITVPMTENWRFRVGDFVHLPRNSGADIFVVREVLENHEVLVGGYNSKEGEYMETYTDNILDIAYAAITSGLPQNVFTKVFESRFSASNSSRDADYSIRVYKVDEKSPFGEDDQTHYSVVWGPSPSAYSPPGTYNTTFAKFSTKENLLNELYNIRSSESLSEVAEFQYISPTVSKIIENIGDYVSSGITFRERESVDANFSHPSDLRDFEHVIARANFERKIDELEEKYGSVAEIPNSVVEEFMDIYGQPAPERHPLADRSENKPATDGLEFDAGFQDHSENDVYFYWRN